MKKGFPWLTSIVLYVSTLAIIFAPKILNGYLLAAEDGRVQNFPAFASPGLLWTSLLLTGFPVLADPQTCMFYPICFLARQLPTFAGWNLYVLSAYFFSALFAALFAFRLTKSAVAALTAGLIYGLGGYQISELRHVQITQTAAWLPLLLLIVDCLRSKEYQIETRILQFVGMVLVSALTILAGHPQTATYIFAAALIYAVCGHGLQKSNWKSVVRLTLLCSAAIIAGAALAAVQLLPSYELSQESVRANFGYKDFLVGELEPMQMLGFLMPYLLGGHYGSLEGLPFSEQGPPPGLMFFGLGPVLLSVFAIWRLRSQPVVLYLLGITVVSFLFAVGDHTPLAPLFHALPVLGSFRGLYRVLLLPAFAVSIFSAIAIAEIEKRKVQDQDNISKPSFKSEIVQAWRQTGKWKHVLLCLYFLLSCLLPTFLLGTLPLLIFAMRPSALWRKALLVVSIFAMLFSYAINSQWYKESSKITQFNSPPGCSELIETLTTDNQRIFTLRGIAAGDGEFPPNLSRLWKIANASGYEPLMPRRYMKLLGMAEGGFLQPPWRIAASDRSFDICAVRYLMAPADAFGGRAFVDDAWKFWKLKSNKDGVLCYENLRARPRFYIVPSKIDVSEKEAYAAIKHGSLNGAIFNPEDVVLVEGASNLKNDAEARPLDSISSVGVENLSDEKIELSTEADFSGYLVVADQYYPGWKATIDGHPAAILKANFVQRAIQLPAGKHKVTFSYVPESYRLGLTISALVLALLSLVAIVALVRTKLAWRKPG